MWRRDDDDVVCKIFKNTYFFSFLFPGMNKMFCKLFLIHNNEFESPADLLFFQKSAQNRTSLFSRRKFISKSELKVLHHPQKYQISKKWRP